MRPALHSGDDIGLRDHEHGIGKVGKQARGGIEAAGGIDHDEAIVIDQQIEEACEFGGRGRGGIRLLRAGEQMQAVLGHGHEAIEQGSVKAVQVLERVGDAEAGAQVEMKLGVADGSEIDQNHVAVGLLQRERGVDGGGGGSGAAFGAEKSENAGFARAAASTSAVGAEAGESFEQSLGAGAIVEILSRTGAHAGHDGGGLLHAAIGEDGELERVGLNQFDGFDCGLRIGGRNIHQDNLCAEILNLAQDGIGRASGKADIAEHSMGEARGFDAILQI